MKRKNLYRLLIPLFALMFLSVATVAYAITITVDGVQEAAWSGSGGQVPGSQSDADDAGITDGYDVEEFLWTNDATNMYFLLNTYDDTIWTGNPRPTLIICLDTDNNTATGGSYTNCNGMSGIDRSIVVSRLNGAGTLLTGEVYDGDPNFGTYLNDIQEGARAGDINEISVSLSDLGMDTGATCSSIINAVVYFDNGIVDPDDLTPDTGTFTLSCGAPTAVSLQSFSAESGATPAVLFGSLMMLLLVAGATAYVLHRRQQLTLITGDIPERD